MSDEVNDGDEAIPVVYRTRPDTGKCFPDPLSLMAREPARAEGSGDVPPSAGPTR